MKIKIAVCILLLFLIFVSSCHATVTPEPTPSPEPTPTATEFSPTGTAMIEQHPTEAPILAHEDAFETNSLLCQSDGDPGAFSVLCSDGKLIINQANSRKAREIIWYKDIPADDLHQFQILASVLSLPPEGVPVDQNQYGVFFGTGEDTYHALRIMNQYFSFQKWLGHEETKVEERTNFSFSPFLNPAGQENTIQLDCSQQICDLSINTEFAGRISVDTAEGVSTVGIFASSRA